MKGVVRGIGDYGNCMGIPNITGQLHFHPSYNQNVVVNALALGYFAPGDTIIGSSAKKGEGHLLVYGGSPTGRDGIHGASMASESFTQDTEDKKPCVQIGDPFYGKLLMEACLQVMREGLVTAAQDMGAAGLISSSFELISKSRAGMDLNLSSIPLRDSTMSVEDILLSETQERVLLVVPPTQWTKVKAVFEKFELPVQKIGKLTKDPQARLFWKNQCLLRIPPQLLTDKAPRYQRPFQPISRWIKKQKNLNHEHKIKNPGGENKKPASLKPDFEKTLLSVLRDLRFCSRKFVYEQYDQSVGTCTVKDCEFPFGVLRLPHSGRGLGLCLGGRPSLMRANPYEGGKDAVIRPALHLALRGFLPLALTDGLNFGSPENQQVMGHFVACVEGMACAARTLDTPVVSGNVSFYNDTQGRPISPTPVTALVGLKEDLKITACELSPTPEKEGEKQAPGGGVYLLSSHQLSYTGLFGETQNREPFCHGHLNEKLCGEFMHLLLDLNTKVSPRAARVVGKAGLAYALSRLILNSRQGIHIQTDEPLFEEKLYGVVLVLSLDQIKTLKTSMDFKNFQLKKLGQIIPEPELWWDPHPPLPVSKLKEAYHTPFVS